MTWCTGFLVAATHAVQCATYSLFIMLGLQRIGSVFSSPFGVPLCLRVYIVQREEEILLLVVSDAW